MASQKPFSLDECDLPAERQFYTLGFVVQMLSRPPHDVVRLIRDAGVLPVYSHNGVPVFDGKSVELLVEHLKLNVAFEAQAEAAKNN